MAAWQMSVRRRCASVWIPLMGYRNKTPVPASQWLRMAEALYETETSLKEEGRSRFGYDEKLDVFRFREDG